jgi:branched-chain amino acid transport system substrate-binding protein
MLSKWKKLGFLLLLVVIVSSFLALSACKSTSTTTSVPVNTTTSSVSTTSTAATTPVSQANKTFTVGCVTDFSSKEGLEIKKWHDLFAKVINANGGWKVGSDTYNLNIITYDGGLRDDAKSRAAFEKLIYEDKVKIIIDTFEQNDKQATQICQQNQVLLFGEGFTDDTAGPDLTYCYRTTGIYFGRAMNFSIASDYYAKGSRTLAFINGNSEQSQVQIKQYGMAYKMAGFTVVDPVLYSSDTVDFGPIATKVISEKADSVCFPDAGSSLAINIMGALYDAGWKGTMFPSSLNASDLTKIYAKVGSWCDGMLGLYLDPRGLPAVQNNPQSKGWLDAYTKEYGTFKTDGCLWVSGFWFLQDAVSSTQSVDPEVIRKYMDNDTHYVSSLTGYVQLYARPDLKNYRTMESAFSDGIAQAKGGVFSFYEPDTVMDQYYASIKAYGLLDTYKAYWAQYGQPTFPPDAKDARFNADWLNK